MQPTYLPWLGYFDMISRSDCFVLLDNVQFEKKSWQQRNRIKTGTGELMLTVPVLSAGRFEQRIMETEIDVRSPFATKHVKSMTTAYAKAPHLRDLLSGLSSLLQSGETSLALFNESLIRWIASALSITTPIIRASKLQASGRGTELTVAQLQELGATTFLAAAGSRPYVSAEHGFAQHGIDVEFHNYEHPVYPQLHEPFISHLSAVDALFNLGSDQAAALVGPPAQERV